MCSALLLFGVVAEVDADWYVPIEPQKFFSENGAFVIKCPEKRLGTRLLLLDVRAKPKQIWATNGPTLGYLIQGFVSRSGRFVVLQEGDDIRGARTLRFLGRNGKPIKVHHFDMSQPSFSYIRPNDREWLYCSVRGDWRVFSLETGVKLQMTAQGLREAREEAAERLRNQFASQRMETKWAAARGLCVIRDVQSKGKLLALLDLEGYETIYPFLEGLLGDELSIELERRSLTARSQKDFERWWSRLGTGPLAEASVLRITRAHPQWVKALPRETVLYRRMIEELHKGAWR